MLLDDQIFERISTSLKAGQYNLLLGSGVSKDSRNEKGDLPSGEELRTKLCRLKGARENSSLQRVYGTLTPAEIHEHVVDHYKDCTPGPSVTKLTRYLWRRIFTWNIDDALETAYDINEASQECIPVHFRDIFTENSNLTTVQIIHLHGWVRQVSKGFVFSRDEYIRQTTEINPWMVLLTQFFPVEPFIILGTSFDEIDLDYYLAHRTPITARDDRGPSILVEPNSDAVTKNDCEKYDFVLYEGTAEAFMDELLRRIPHRPTPIELIPKETRNLLPPHVSDVDRLAFSADFELIPGIVSTNPMVTRFFFGGIPRWQDLASNKDIGRLASGTIVQRVVTYFSGLGEGPKMLLVEYGTGSGKSTVIRRAMFELAKQGITALNCSATGVIEPLQTAAAINLLDGPLAIMIDDFADQVNAVRELIGCLKKKDIVFVCAERVYRRRYIEQAMSGIPYEQIGGLRLREIDADRLVETYRRFGLLGTPDVTTNVSKRRFVQSIKEDPIAIACCRILNDLRPLNRIVTSLIEQTPELELKRYLMTALAHHCFRSGIRYSVLRFASGGGEWRRQFIGTHQMPLILSASGRGEFVLPENSTLASSILQRISDEDKGMLLTVFVDLANAIAPRVNPEEIRKRAPETRLAARLFDYDQVVAPFLGDHAFDFYEETRARWRWNSRYWSQIALMYLSVYYHQADTDTGREALVQAEHHARHAISIERHPLILTTLGQVLIAQMNDDNVSISGSFDEAFELLSSAISVERRWIRPSVHPFVTIFRGSRDYRERGGVLTANQISSLRDLEHIAQDQFDRDKTVREVLAQLKQVLP